MHSTAQEHLQSSKKSAIHEEKQGMEQKADVNKSESRTPSCVSEKLFDIRAAKDKQEGAVKLTRSSQGI